MPAIVASTEVDRPAAEVFASATDPARFSEWQRACWKGTWMILPTAPARLPWARAAR